MKILYAIQGTGNGHLSRARDIIPELLKHAELDIMVSGVQCDVDLGFPITYRKKGISFIFGKKGGVDVWKSFQNFSSFSTIKEIFTLPVEKYDLVINDFEPISAWACLFKGVPCVGLSHQSALLSKNVPAPETSDFFGNLILKYYAPVSEAIGFHFKRYDQFIYTPIIRQQIRDLKPTSNGTYLVYLPAYADAKIIEVLAELNQVNWVVFSKHSAHKYKINNIEIEPINNERFIQELEKCSGVLCGAGFETPAEAIFLGKKLLVIPMKGQHEQHYNAMGLKDIGVPVIPKLASKFLPALEKWISSNRVISVNYPNQTNHIVKNIIEKHQEGKFNYSSKLSYLFR